MDRRETLRKLGDILGVRPEGVPEALAKLKRETEELEARLKQTNSGTRSRPAG